MQDNAPFAIQIASQPRLLCAVRDAVERLAGQWGLAGEDAGRVVLAVDEALANVIRHGYRGQEDRPIWLKLWPIQQGDRRGIRVVIEDECEPVDPATIKGRDLDEIRPGGLGTHIMRKAMDRVEYSRRVDQAGMRVEMEKLNSPAEAPAQKG